MRKSLRALAAIVAAANPGVLSFHLAAISGDKSLKFNGSVVVDGTAYSVAADNGKIKKYADADGFTKDLAAYFATPTGTYEISVETGLVLVSPLPADLKKNAASKVVSLGAKKTAQQAIVTALDAGLVLMDGWDVGNALQVARFNEVTAQKVSVVADIAAIDALIVTYTAIANS